MTEAQRNRLDAIQGNIWREMESLSEDGHYASGVFVVDAQRFAACVMKINRECERIERIVGDDRPRRR